VETPRHLMKTQIAFLREFLRNPGAVGAIAPSSPSLAREMVRQAGVLQARTIVEFGPGTGAFTREIVKQAVPEARFLAIERNPTLARILQQELPSVRVCHDSVENLGAILHREGIGQVDCILSGLPWAAFSEQLQDRLLEEACRNLAPRGRFVTFAYLQGLLLPAGRRFARKIRRKFAHTEKSPVVWRNLPPAFVYRCQR
jgi:phosphatidylethanolamine/phosphatidyl-N-methylethanolamine N-methyltransferase